MTSRVYPIATLLGLGAMKQPAGVELRINPGALTGKRNRFSCCKMLVLIIVALNVSL